MAESSTSGMDTSPLSSIQPINCRGGPAPWKQEEMQPLEPYLVGCPPLILGGSVFGAGIFNDDGHISSQEPIKAVRLAFQYGINAIDTSPYYGDSEIVLGKILKTLEPEYPRESYYIQTKVGRYGPTLADFDYSPQRIEESVSTSLKRLNTTYLDTVLMHDVEYVSDQGSIEGAKEGFYAFEELQEEEKFDVAHSPEMAADRLSSEDEKVLKAIQTLFKLRDQGVIRNVGISGYPLPVLLRISRLLAGTPPHRPLDIILSYSNHTLHCDLLTDYRETRFAAKPRGSKPDWVPPKLMNASPFSMGLLTDRGPPDWHPAPAELRAVCKEVSKELQKKRGSSLTLTASRYGIRGSEVREKHSLRPTLCTVVGLSTVEEVHQIVQSYRVMLSGAHLRQKSSSGGSALEPLSSLTPSTNQKLQKEYLEQRENEAFVIDYFKQRNWFNWCWASPPRE